MKKLTYIEHVCTFVHIQYRQSMKNG